MDLQRFCVKFFAQPSAQIDDTRLIDIFHDWIRAQLPLGTLIDVADYRHVPNGPSVMLIAHEANFAVDRGHDGLGLMYQTKREQTGDVSRRLLQAIRHALDAAQRLAQDSRLAGDLEFNGGEFLFLANDRLLAPNSEETMQQLEPSLRQVGTTLYGDEGFELQRVDGDPRERFAVRCVARDKVDAGSVLAKARDALN